MTNQATQTIRRGSSNAGSRRSSNASSNAGSRRSSNASSNAGSRRNSEEVRLTEKEKKARAKKATCIRNVGNFSKIKPAFIMDKPQYKPEQLMQILEKTSPKIVALFNEIKKLDEQDLKQHGKHFKHMIFTDLNNSTYGIKVLASAFDAHSYKFAQNNMLQVRPKEELLESKGNNFGVLVSKTFFKKPMNVKNRKEMLQTFNSRPDNVEGDVVRFIILDQGFKEGIDLYDIKYVHLFENLTVAADQKQSIGRATRFCGQSGLKFDPRYGWPLFVMRYEVRLPEINRDKFGQTIFDMYLKYVDIDVRKINFANELDNVVQDAAVDAELTHSIHTFNVKYPAHQLGGSVGSRTPKPPSQILNHSDMRKHINKYFGDFKYPLVKLQNNCEQPSTSNSNKKLTGNLVDFTQTQDFVRHYFTSESPYKGILFYHSVGSGKTCSAIATASNSFDKDNYTILWVTRHTLKADIWKNMFNQVCHIGLQEKIKQGKLSLPNKTVMSGPLKYLSKNWMAPISYKQFSNMLQKKNKIYEEMVRRNGEQDPLRKTLVIIDEAHKLYSPTADAKEKPNTDVLEKMIHNSYKVSGKDSVRLLVMTGTPYTEDAMEMIKLLNLLRPKSDAIPADFKYFSRKYLSEDGTFTRPGKAKFSDDISGYISYLNRSQDARNFAYPIIKDVFVPLTQSSRNKLSNEIWDLRDKVNDLKRVKPCMDGVRNEFNTKIDKLKYAKEVSLSECKELPKADRKSCQEEEREAYREASDELKDWKRHQIAECKIKNVKEIEKAREEIFEKKKLMKNDYSQENALIKRCSTSDYEESF